METKSLLTSKTFYFGLAQMLLGLVGFITGLMGSTEATTLILTGVGTIGFRLSTDKPVTL